MSEAALRPGGWAAELGSALAEAAEQRRSGVLRATRGRLRRLFCLQRGAITYAASNVREEQFVEALAGAGLLDAERRSALESAAAREGGKLAALAVREGVLDESALRQAMAAHVERLLFATLNWTHGELQFEGGTAQLEGEVTVEVYAAPALLAYAVDHVPSLDEVRLRLGPPNLRPLIVERRRAVLAGLALGELGSYLEKRCDGTASLAEIVGRSPSGTETTLRMLYGLKLMGLVTQYVETRRTDKQSTQAVTVDEMMARLKRAEEADYYALLELSPTCTRDEVRDTYYFLARRYHPDRFRNGPLQSLLPAIEGYFARVTEAYNNLWDPALRSEYDRKRSADEPAPRQAEPEQDRAHLAKQNYARAKLLINKGRNTDAVTFLENAVELDDMQALYHVTLGSLLLRNPRRRDDAERHLVRASQLEPTRFESYLGLAELYLKQNRNDRAMAMLREVLRWEPDHVEAREQLAALEAGRPVSGTLGMFRN